MLNVWFIVFSLVLFFVFNGAKVEIIFEQQKKNVSFFNKKLTFYKILF